MIRIALVEDEAEVRAQLQGYVQRHTRQYGTEFAVTEFADGMYLLCRRCGHYRRSSRSDPGSHSAKERIEWPVCLYRCRKRDSLRKDAE